MKCKTKNLLTEEQIKMLVNKNFGNNCIIKNIKELKGGMFNSAYLIEAEGNNLVLKVSVGPDTPLLSYEKDIMAREIEVYQIITDKTEIPVPKVLAVDFSKRLISSNYFFMTALQGNAMNTLTKKLKVENKDKLKEELARYFAQLHQVKGVYFGYFTEDSKYRFSTWREGFLHMTDMILNDGKKLQIALPYERIEKVLKETAHYLDGIMEPALVDYDLWAGNVFLIQEGEEYKVEGILDFERAFWGDPLADFPSAMMILQELKKEKAFFKVYAKETGREEKLSKEDLVRLTLYKTYLHLIMTVETYRYNFLYACFQKSYAKKVVLKCIKELEEKGLNC
ncbi:Predicted kinase, aminoglycoside phosphotransferase (APT) family [Anaerocolumna jejuensis DSM 15929]|uniref:Predicted kinase, aminoglycoside phosphotransferase (APT) family n=1 Tax=Anaerocolumna jejuensis DSM 15929 TaxID=1121322 RepID=A0A1M7BTN6_9FIRM|nr:aminoglycoside phosphotransferase family protein [Anaerocolumna jejuensis]SHL58385.1 Predicted kinase, aminoglycoside phosphotransferase (APT) family [Anaerocolumna jejuensis DSM 15929]